MEREPLASRNESVYACDTAKQFSVEKQGVDLSESQTVLLLIYGIQHILINRTGD